MRRRLPAARQPRAGDDWEDPEVCVQRVGAHGGTAGRAAAHRTAAVPDAAAEHRRPTADRHRAAGAVLR